jgi:hypothetical protein
MQEGERMREFYEVMFTIALVGGFLGGIIDYLRKR